MLYFRPMPFLEGESPDRPSEYQTTPQPSLVPFLIAAQFRSEPTSERAYFEAQNTIKRHQVNDLSVYRFQLRSVFHVAILGEIPPQPLEQRLRRILAAGDPAALPEDIVSLLLARRAEASQQGPWVERHYRGSNQ